MSVTGSYLALASAKANGLSALECRRSAFGSQCVPTTHPHPGRVVLKRGAQELGSCVGHILALGGAPAHGFGLLARSSLTGLRPHFYTRLDSKRSTLRVTDGPQNGNREWFRRCVAFNVAGLPARVAAHRRSVARSLRIDSVYASNLRSAPPTCKNEKTPEARATRVFPESMRTIGRPRTCGYILKLTSTNFLTATTRV